MESRIFPDWDHIKNFHNPLTDGEKTLLIYLDNNLPKDSNWKVGSPLSEYHGWLIFVQPYLNGSRPDIILFNPYVGIQIIEVKDWNLKCYGITYNKDKKQSEMYATNKEYSYTIKRPDKQVEYYKNLLIEQLVPKIGETIDNINKVYGLIKVSVYFHNETTERANEFFREFKISKNIPLFGQDMLKENNIHKIVKDSVLDKSIFWNSSWNNEILFWLKPPIHSLEQAESLKLTTNQMKITQSLKGHNKVCGVAGSGKTQALAYRAANLASQKKKVLILTFNITLWHYIKDMISRAPFHFSWEYITINHFHLFCSNILNNAGVNWPAQPADKNDEKKMEEYFKRTIPEHVIKTIKQRKLILDKYDAILIDEGQDYNVEWYSMLNRYFLSENDEILIVYDKKQNIYQRELEWFDKRSQNIELYKLKSEIIYLNTTFRLPKRIASLANKFNEQFVLEKETKIEKYIKDTSLVYSDHIVWVNNPKGFFTQNIFYAYEKLKSEGESASDIVILVPTHKMGLNLVTHFEKYKIRVNHVFENNEDRKGPHRHKKSFWLGDGRLKMCTIHSFKGWELMNIIIYIPEQTQGNEKQMDSILYTALTRSRKNLIIFNNNERYFEFGEALPKRWDNQDIF